MTIDTNELRRLAQAALAGPDGISLNWIKLLQDFQQKASPAAVIELLDRLEAAESTRRDDYQNWMAALDRNAGLLAKLEAAEKELAELRSSMKFRTSLIGRTEAERDALRAKIAEMEKQGPAAEWFDWLPQGTTHISRIRSVTIPCFGFEARFNAFKYINGVLHTYRTDTDNEYGEWVKADSRYRNAVLPTVYPLSGAQGKEK